MNNEKEINSIFKKYFNNQEFIDGFMEAEAENPILTESINENSEYKDNTIKDMFKTNNTKPITEEEFINNVVNDIVDNLEDEGANTMEESDYEYYLINGGIVARAIETEEKNTVELYLDGAWQEKDYDEEITKRWPDLGKSIIGIDYGVAMETLGKEADFVGRYSDDIEPRKDISSLGPIDTMDEVKFIDIVANDIVNDLDNEAKQITLEYPEYDHFGRGLWIRNHYLWCQNLPETYRHPDDLSSVIFEKVIEKLKEN